MRNMPRRAREKSSTGIYHILIKGINRRSIFEDDKDYAKMIEIIQKCKEQSEFKFYGYCLMANHVHLLMREGTEAISLTMQKINSAYANWYNRKYDRFGHLFQDRYKSEPVEDVSYMLTVLRYIHQNPIKAGITKTVEDYKWTSYHEYSSKQTLIDRGFILALFASERHQAIEKIKNYMNENNEDICLDYQETKRFTDEEVREIISEKYGVIPGKFLLLDKEEQNIILKNIKAIKGTTIRQVARVTGTSKYMVEKA